MRNIDKIRKMSSKELANFIFNTTGDSICDICVNRNSCVATAAFEDDGCCRGIKKWLKQEVKE